MPLLSGWTCQKTVDQFMAEENSRHSVARIRREADEDWIQLERAKCEFKADARLSPTGDCRLPRALGSALNLYPVRGLFGRRPSTTEPTSTFSEQAESRSHRQVRWGNFFALLTRVLSNHNDIPEDLLMSPFATALPSADETPPRFQRWLPVLAILLVLVGGVICTNYLLDPLTYSTSAQQEAADSWVKGQSVAMLDANVDLRELRREHISRMTETPDVIVFGGSRFQEASSQVAPGKKFYNAFVSNDHFEDMMAFVQLLDANKRLPKTLVLSVRFSTFEYLGGREAWWWKSFAPEYIQMAKRLRIDTYSQGDLMNYQKYTHLLSAEAAYERLRRYSTTKAVWTATSSPQNPLMDTIAPDGSLHFSEAYLKSASRESARQDVAQRLSIDRKATPQLNEQLLGQMSKLLDFLKDRGVRVVMIQTPYHPVFYEGLQGTSFLKSINHIEQAVQELAKKKGITITGGFDPTSQGCVEADFRDFNHSGIDCMKKLFAKVPNLG